MMSEASARFSEMRDVPDKLWVFFWHDGTIAYAHTHEDFLRITKCAGKKYKLAEYAITKEVEKR